MISRTAFHTSRSSSRRALLGAAGLSAAICLVMVDGGQVVSSLGPLYALGLFLHSALQAGLLFAGVAAAGFLLEGLITVEIMHKAVLATLVAGPLAFAQASDPGAGKADEGASRAQALPPHGEIQFGLYAGGNGVFDADVMLNQPNGTDMTLKDVRWRGESYRSPPYYGMRATFWPPQAPSFGVMIDYVHAKAIADRQTVVEQTGMRDGKPVPPREAPSATLHKLEYSHGLNFLTLNAVYRFRGLSARLLPYFGAGIGIMIPHTEIARKGTRREDWTYRYEYTGLGLQALAGAEWRIRPGSRFQPFAEAKLGYARNHTDLVEGGWARSRLYAYQLAFGVSAYAQAPVPLLAR